RRKSMRRTENVRPRRAVSVRNRSHRRAFADRGPAGSVTATTPATGWSRSTRALGASRTLPSRNRGNEHTGVLWMSPNSQAISVPPPKSSWNNSWKRGVPNFVSRPRTARRSLDHGRAKRNGGVRIRDRKGDEASRMHLLHYQRARGHRGDPASAHRANEPRVE